jgi:hypothetical protein
MEEARKKMRSNQIVSFRYEATQVEDTAQVTGGIWITTRDGDEILIFQAVFPMPKTDFMTRFAALETQLNEPWFEIPTQIDYVA